MIPNSNVAPQRLIELFGEVSQLGYVVQDIDKTMQGWINQLGVAPFVVIPAISPFTSYRYRGEPCEAPSIKVAFAQLGNLQLELIQPLDDKPSTYREFLDSGREGFHHYAFRVDHFEETLERAEAAGFKPVLQTGVPEMSSCCYLEAPDIPGFICEIVRRSPATDAFFDCSIEATKQWDGGDPVVLLKLDP